jgi:hypothetical protein
MTLEDDQKKLLEEKQQEQLDKLAEFVKNSLKLAQEQTAERVISTMISNGLALSNIAEGLANITDTQGKHKATGLIEQAISLLEEDEA